VRGDTGLGIPQPMQDRQRSKAVGFDQRLVKPVDLAGLTAAIAGQSAPN
jgi:hypothetical protein